MEYVAGSVEASSVGLVDDAKNDWKTKSAVCDGPVHSWGRGGGFYF